MAALSDASCAWSCPSCGAFFEVLAEGADKGFLFLLFMPFLFFFDGRLVAGAMGGWLVGWTGTSQVVHTL